MKVLPLAADSMGVRSMATLVEVGSHRIVFDPGAALAPRRFGLPPAEPEKKALNDFKAGIVNAVESCDIIVISHYHHDHFDPNADYFRGKHILLKSYESEINYHQHERALRLRARLKHQKADTDLRLCDGRTIAFDDELELSFSVAVPHGAVGARSGYVIMTAVREDDRTFLFCSDIAGPIESFTTDLIIASDPDIIYIDGPPTHLLNTHLEEAALDRAINNILEIITCTGATVILDHHLLRDRDYRNQLFRIYETGPKVMTAAEYSGEHNNLLEANRQELWQAAGDLIEQDRKT